MKTAAKFEYREMDSQRAGYKIISRHFNADTLNRVVNHPEVHPWVRGKFKGTLDLTPVLKDSGRHICLMGEHGGCLFTMHQPGLYEVHTQVLPEGRGKWTLRMVNEALRWMFTRTDAIELFTRVPKGNVGALALVKAIRGTFEFTRPNGWWIEDHAVDADIYTLKYSDWARHAPALKEKGVWFHHRLEEEYRKLHVRKPQHADDLVHDQYVGCCVETIMGGQVHKAVIFYNRWASMAGYGEVRVVTVNPVVIDIQDALIMVRDNDMWVMTCQSAQL